MFTSCKQTCHRTLAQSSVYKYCHSTREEIVKEGNIKEVFMLDDPQVNDNRKYNYVGNEVIHRAEYPFIVDMIPAGSSVIDFACGNGSLLQLLRDKKKCDVAGIDISESAVNAAKQKGLPNIFLGAIDQEDPQFQSTYDYSICNVTIQMVMFPEILLKRMATCSKYQIVSFPNFAFYKNRLDMMFRGRMPKPLLFGYDWYSTGHIHQLSITDFKETISKMNMEIVQSMPVHGPKFGPGRWLTKTFPNVFSVISIFLLKSKDHGRLYN